MTLHRVENSRNSACLAAELLGDNNTLPGTFFHKMMQHGAVNSLYQEQELKKDGVSGELEIWVATYLSLPTKVF